MRAQTKQGALASAPNGSEMAVRRTALAESTNVELILDDTGGDEDQKFRFIIDPLGLFE